MTKEQQGDNELTPRQREVLRLLVQEYVASAAPVGSGTLLNLGNLSVSSATVRNELVRLEDLGYVQQLHTSSGRVPTVKGYRYYIEQLMENIELPAPSRRMIRHQFHQIRLNMDQWLQLTAAVLAHSTRSASLVTAPHAARSRLKHIELISTHDTLFLMILVLNDGRVYQEMMVVEEPVDQDQLRQLSNWMNDQFRNLTVQEVSKTTEIDSPILSRWAWGVVDWLMRRMEDVDARAIDEIHHAGLANVLAQPEFEDVSSFRQLVDIMEQRQRLELILARALSSNGVQVIIGGEGPFEGIYDVSLVLSPYGARDKASGVLGIVGPRRMSYANAVSTVRYVATLMGNLIEDVYGSPTLQ